MLIIADLHWVRGILYDMQQLHNIEAAQCGQPWRMYACNAAMLLAHHHSTSQQLNTSLSVLRAALLAANHLQTIQMLCMAF